MSVNPFSRRGGFWLVVYLGLIVTPMLLAMATPTPQASGFAWDFAMALGYAGVAMIGVQFVLTARFRRASAPFGIDVVYLFHRYLAVSLLGLILVHAGLASLLDHQAVGPLDPRRVPLAISLGRLALLLLMVLVVSSLWRKRIGIEYDHWRRWHATLATLALVLAVVHVEMAARFLEAPIQRVLWSSISLCWLGLIVYVRVIRPWRLLRLRYRVLAVESEAGSSVSLQLAPEGHAGFSFLPGQFAWISVGDSPFALREHPFSIASAPRADGQLRFTIKALGDFSRRMAAVEAGALVYVDGPYGAFSCDRHADASGFLFIAGGIGIVPIMSMLRALADRADKRPIWLFYANRLWQHTVFPEELAELSQRLPLRVVHILGEPPADWMGERGLLSLALLRRHLPRVPAGVHGFVCGPRPMIKIAERALQELEVPLARVHSEIFDLA